ncbi:MAG: hypothetical protein HQ591_03120 [candidate division Zixibacteria bacterium]|nr:hypothetical protein [Candidatus Tariuqbacter arcticus]
MKPKFSLGLLLIIFLFTDICVYAVDVTLLVNRRGFPRKKDCYIRISLSDSKGQLNPSNEAFYQGEYLRFVITSEGDWKLDDDFLNDVLPSIIFEQGNQVFKILKSEPSYDGKKISKILISVQKELDTSQPFTVSIARKDITDNAQLFLPQEMWQGYPQLMKEFETSKQTYELGLHLGSFTQLTALLDNPQLSKFTFYEDVANLRRAAYSGYHQSIVDDFIKIRLDTTLTDESKLSQLRDLNQRYIILIDSMVFDTSVVSPDLEKLSEIRADAVKRYYELLESIDRISINLDYSKIQCLKDSGPEDHRFRLLIEALYTAVRAQKIGSLWENDVKLPDSIVTRIEAFGLTENLNALRRIIASSMDQDKALLSTPFIGNIRTRLDSYNIDTVPFTQPYIAVIMMANHYYQGDLDSVEYYLDKAFNGSSDTALNDWLMPIKTGLISEKSTVSAELKEMSDKGMELLLKAHFDEALKEFQRAEIIAPNSPLIAYDLGIYNLVMKDTLKAITYFERALQLDSTMSVVYRRLYNLYITQTKWDNAINMLEIVKSNDNAWEYNFFLAFCYTKVENYQATIACLNQAAALNSKNYIQYIYLGDAYLKLGNTNVAKEQYDHARQLEPNRPEAYDRLKQIE